MRDAIIECTLVLARNYADMPFPTRMSSEDAELSLQRMLTAMKAGHEDYSFLPFSTENNSHTALLAEERLLHRLPNAGRIGGVLISPDHTRSVVANADDHLHARVCLPGAQLKEAYISAMSAIQKAGLRYPFAFDPQWGYLTASPSLTGTGMQSSVLLHLPQTSRSRKASSPEDRGTFTVEKGLRLQPLISRNSEAAGDLYLLTNISSMGLSEEDILDALNREADLLAEKEAKLLKARLAQDSGGLLDTVRRSEGLLKYAYRMNYVEFADCWSGIRTGILSGMLSYDLNDWNRWLIRGADAHVLRGVDGVKGPVAVSEERCRLIRSYLCRKK